MGKEVHTFSKGNSPKVNIIEQLELVSRVNKFRKLVWDDFIQTVSFIVHHSVENIENMVYQSIALIPYSCILFICKVI